MASEEERARIMAEYLAETNNGDVEEEEEFQEDDEDDDEYERKQRVVNCPVLQGRLKLNEEGHLLYLGTWCMKQDLNSSSASSNSKTTFKLKSVEPISKFTLAQPASDTKVVMNGFFHTDHTDQIEPHRKIKEKGVTLEFTKDGASSYQVKGNGTNEFGSFALKGTYTPNEAAKTYWLQCEKFYGGIPDDESEDDEIDSEDEQKDPQELDDLQDDAELTVEELQKKYYGGAAPSPPKAKSSSSRSKAERQERLKKRNGEAAAQNNNNEEEEDSKPPAKKLKKDDEDEDDANGDAKAEQSPPSDKKEKKKIVVAEDEEDDEDDCGF